MKPPPSVERVYTTRAFSHSQGRQLTISHTGSLSGTDDLYQALFDGLGIIRVTSPAQLLEMLKFLCVAGVPGATGWPASPAPAAAG